MIVTELWRYPVKSMGGEKLDGVNVSALGFDGDRRWGVVDALTGNVLTARREPRLLLARASATPQGGVVITIDGEFETDSSDELSRWLGRDVILARAGDTGGTYENPANFENESDWMTWQGPPGAWHDSKRARVSLVTKTSLRDWDVRRFRPNVVLDAGDEDALVGSSVELGTCLLTIAKKIDRCVMVTRPQPGLERDLEILRTINRERATYLAVGALVDSPGRVHIGDSVRMLPQPALDCRPMRTLRS